MASNNAGTVYVTGTFAKKVDFDPGLPEDFHSPVGNSDAFLSSFSPDGDYLGALTWGGSVGSTEGTSVTVDGSDVYVAGMFGGTADLDPGPGEDIHVTLPSFRDAFLSKFNNIGIFLWARSWGGEGEEIVQAISASPSSVYAVGGFSGTVDFDPGPGVDNHVAGNTRNMYLTCFTPSGDFQWADSWETGSMAINDGARAVCSGSDGIAYMAGCFRGTVDFDPSSGIDSHTPVGSYSAFLSKNLPDGTW